MNFKVFLQTVVTIGVLIGMVVGGINYFASARDLQLVEVRLDQKIVSDQIMQVQNRIWQLEDRYKGTSCVNWPSSDDRMEYRRLKEQLEKLKDQLKVLRRRK